MAIFNSYVKLLEGSSLNLKSSKTNSNPHGISSHFGCITPRTRETSPFRLSLMTNPYIHHNPYSYMTYETTSRYPTNSPGRKKYTKSPVLPITSSLRAANGGVGWTSSPPGSFAGSERWAPAPPLVFSGDPLGCQAVVGGSPWLGVASGNLT